MVWPFKGKIGSLTYKQVTQFLTSEGFNMEPKGSTAHEQWIKISADGKSKKKVTVDKHIAPFSVTLIKLMAQQAGYSAREFYALCSGKSAKNEITATATD